MISNFAPFKISNEVIRLAEIATQESSMVKMLKDADVKEVIILIYSILKLHYFFGNQLSSRVKDFAAYCNYFETNICNVKVYY